MGLWLSRPSPEEKPGGGDPGARVVTPLKLGLCLLQCCQPTLLAWGGAESPRVGRDDDYFLYGAGVCSVLSLRNKHPKLGASRARKDRGGSCPDAPRAERCAGYRTSVVS